MEKKKMKVNVREVVNYAGYVVGISTYREGKANTLNELHLDTVLKGLERANLIDKVIDTQGVWNGIVEGSKLVLTKDIEVVKALIKLGVNDYKQDDVYAWYYIGDDYVEHKDNGTLINGRYYLFTRSPELSKINLI